MPCVKFHTWAEMSCFLTTVVNPDRSSLVSDESKAVHHKFICSSGSRQDVLEHSNLKTSHDSVFEEKRSKILPKIKHKTKAGQTSKCVTCWMYLTMNFSSTFTVFPVLSFVQFSELWVTLFPTQLLHLCLFIFNQTQTKTNISSDLTLVW